jgi:hypothetical protein
MQPSSAPSSAISRAAALLLVPLVALAATDAVAVSPKDRRFFSAKLGIGVDAPAGWTISTHTGYPSVIVLLLHPDGSRISVAVSETPAATATELVDLNRKGLEAQRLSVLSAAAGARGGVEVTSRAAARNESVVQLYLVRPVSSGVRQAIVISLFARTDAVPLHRPALDTVLAKLTLEPLEAPAPSATPPEGKDGRSAKPGSAGERPLEKNGR